MKDIATRLKELRRPRLLTQAARIAAQDYARDAHLERLLGISPGRRPAAALIDLLDLEAGLDQCRRQRDSTYSAGQHVRVLTAVVCEAQLWSQASTS